MLEWGRPSGDEDSDSRSRGDAVFLATLVASITTGYTDGRLTGVAQRGPFFQQASLRDTRTRGQNG